MKRPRRAPPSRRPGRVGQARDTGGWRASVSPLTNLRLAASRNAFVVIIKEADGGGE